MINGANKESSTELICCVYILVLYYYTSIYTLFLYYLYNIGCQRTEDVGCRSTDLCGAHL